MLSCQLSCQISLYLPSKLFHNCPPLQLIHLLVFPTGILDLKPYKPAHNVHFQPFLPPKTNQSLTDSQPHIQFSDVSTSKNLTKYICNSYPTFLNKKRHQNPLQQPPLSITPKMAVKYSKNVGILASL